jgi:hypothetical protein
LGRRTFSRSTLALSPVDGHRQFPEKQPGSVIPVLTWLSLASNNGIED